MWPIIGDWARKEGVIGPKMGEWMLMKRVVWPEGVTWLPNKTICWAGRGDLAREWVSWASKEGVIGPEMGDRPLGGRESRSSRLHFYTACSVVTWRVRSRSASDENEIAMKTSYIDARTLCSYMDLYRRKSIPENVRTHACMHENINTWNFYLNTTSSKTQIEFRINITKNS